MKTKLMALCAAALFGSAISARAEGPCHDKREAKHAARKDLHECIASWAHDRNPNQPDPTEDCQGKLSGFVAAAKAVKACVVERAKEHDAKKAQRHQ